MFFDIDSFLTAESTIGTENAGVALLLPTCGSRLPKHLTSGLGVDT